MNHTEEKDEMDTEESHQLTEQTPLDSQSDVLVSLKTDGRHRVSAVSEKALKLCDSDVASGLLPEILMVSPSSTSSALCVRDATPMVSGMASQKLLRLSVSCPGRASWVSRHGPQRKAGLR